MSPSKSITYKIYKNNKVFNKIERMEIWKNDNLFNLQIIRNFFVQIVPYYFLDPGVILAINFKSLNVGYFIYKLMNTIC